MDQRIGLRGGNSPYMMGHAAIVEKLDELGSDIDFERYAEENGLDTRTLTVSAEGELMAKMGNILKFEGSDTRPRGAVPNMAAVLASIAGSLNARMPGCITAILRHRGDAAHIWNIIFLTNSVALR
ncbi:hypothetical protein [Burkholderia ubonensis]|uniref:hypothetical protein n=1 Tax=Burkholderia ubonensis TaxID=101571 RepID=UPI000B1F598B|nr:hypothetical protein [Burkholderia ubonensis]